MITLIFYLKLPQHVHTRARARTHTHTHTHTLVAQLKMYSLLVWRWVDYVHVATCIHHPQGGELYAVNTAEFQGGIPGGIPGKSQS